MLSCKFGEIFKNTFFTEHIQATVSAFTSTYLYQLQVRQNNENQRNKDGRWLEMGLITFHGMVIGLGGIAI